MKKQEPTVEIYQVPVGQWDYIGHKPKKNAKKVKVVASGTYEQALRELVGQVNDEHIDDVNCYLYIKEV